MAEGVFECVQDSAPGLIAAFRIKAV